MKWQLKIWKGGGGGGAARRTVAFVAEEFGRRATSLCCRGLHSVGGRGNSDLLLFLSRFSFSHHPLYFLHLLLLLPRNSPKNDQISLNTKQLLMKMRVTAAVIGCVLCKPPAGCFTTRREVPPQI